MPSRTATRLILTLLLVVGALTLAPTPATGAAAQTPVGGLPSATGLAATSTSPTSLRITWSATSDPGTWWVMVTGPDDRSVGQRTACGSCRSMVVQHLAPGSSYYVRVVALDEQGLFGPFSPWIQTTTPAMPGCAGVPSGTVCALADATAPRLTTTGVGLGSLHAITVDTDPARVRALEPTSWRVSAMDLERFTVARSYGGKVTVILSDPWMNTLLKQSPWVSWDLYEWWLRIVVQTHVDAGLVPDFWDVQNEPSYDSYVGGAQANDDLIFEQYERASNVIHSILPDAVVVGPSVAYPRFGSGLANLTGFIERAKATGTPLGGLTWHEIGASCLGYCDGSPRAVLQHADDARAALAANGMSGVPLIVNEWGAPWAHRQPGAIVGYLSSLAYAGIDVSNPTCWNSEESGYATCFTRPGQMGGTLQPDGTTPTDAWFAHQAYAAMTGPGMRLLDSTIADPEASVIGTVDGGGTVRLLLGRHTGCQTDLDDACPGLAYFGPRDVRVRVTVPAGRSYTATVDRIPSVSGALSGPTRVAQRTVTAGSGGSLDVGTYTVADGEALSVVLVPSTQPTTTTTVPPTTTTPTTRPTTTTTRPTPTTTTPTTQPTTPTTGSRYRPPVRRSGASSRPLQVRGVS